MGSGGSEGPVQDEVFSVVSGVFSEGVLSAIGGARLTVHRSFGAEYADDISLEEGLEVAIT